ncbi:MAG TPA: DNA-formamidopyrimidine glycosylase family protein [Thermoanaerobaculia bacterium]|nr:DNA-formamidopyrimidine glycosylase family protein [Thermoanaerobaculia bacterium]
MPELPEVEIYRQYFARHALDQAISRVRVLDERVLGNVRKDRLTRELKGRFFTAVRRHGKHLFADAGATWLHLHFGMTGDLAYYRDPKPPPRFARVVFDFASGAHLAFEDLRLFGVVDLTPSPEAFIAEHHLGPDPLDPSFRLPLFRRLISGRRGAVKSLLLSQDMIAGIGNLWADETLFHSAIHPRRPVDRLTDTEVRTIHAAMRRILREVVECRERGADLPRRYLIHRREEGERCPLCAGSIQRSVVFGRTTYFCGTHQR